jgi:hypothetical protein
MYAEVDSLTCTPNKRIFGQNHLSPELKASSQSLEIAVIKYSIEMDHNKHDVLIRQ